MFAWARLLFSHPPPHTPLTRYTAWNGLLYLLLGATFYAWPGSAQTLLRAPPFQAGEAGLVRAVGFAIALIGYFYVFGARTGQDRFGVATIPDRLLVPVFLVPLVVTGQLAPQLGLPLAVIDPALAVGAWIVHTRSSNSSSPLDDRGRPQPMSREHRAGELACSFCGKGQREVRKLIAGPTVCICDECVLLCTEIIAETSQGDAERVRRELKQTELKQAQSLERVLWHAQHPDAKQVAIIARHFAKACDESLDVPRPVAERARSFAEEIEALGRG